MKTPTPLPLWYWPWLRWRLGLAEFKQFGPMHPAHRPKSAPKPIPDWAMAKMRAFDERRRKPQLPVKPPVPVEHPSLAFWRRMGAWVTRIDHFPPVYVEEYAQDEYKIIVVPCLYGQSMEPFTEGLLQYVVDVQRMGYRVVGSGWGKPQGIGDCAREASMAVTMVKRYGFDGWVMNGEKLYEAVPGGSAAYIKEFRRVLPNTPLGWSPEPRISLDYEVFRSHGVMYMPQAYPLENGRDVAFVCEWGKNFGFKSSQILPLIQAYPSPNGLRYDPDIYRAQARAAGVSGLVLYAANQATDVPEFWRKLVV